MSPENSLQSLSVIPRCQYCVRRSQEAIQGLQSEVQANEMHNTEQRCKCKIVTILIFQENMEHLQKQAKLRKPIFSHA